MLWFLAAFLLIVLFYGTKVYLFDKRYRMPPGPVPLPFIGSFYSIPATKPFWQAANDISKRYGPVVTFYAGQVRMVFITGTKTIHETLVTQSDIFSSRIDIYLPGMENTPEALVSGSGEPWRQKRRFAMRAMRDFGMGKDAMVTQIQDEVVQLLPEIANNKGQPFNPRRLITNAISNIICCLVLGKRFHYDDTQFVHLLHTLDKIFSYSPKYSLPFFVFPFLGYFKRNPANAAYMSFVTTLGEMGKDAINEARKDFDQENIRHFPDLYIQTIGKEDALDFFNFNLVMVDMFMAGTETTSTALSWTLAYLGTYPEIQARCHEAIDRAIDTARLPSLKDRPNLVYIDAVMCEVLRHASIVPTSLLHSNFEEAKINGYDIPPKTAVMYNVTALHRDPTYWRDSDVFNPDRWISPDGKLLNHSTHFMPFGIGPRICLGEALAKAEYFLFIVPMLQRFRFSLKEPIDLSKDHDGIVRAPPPFEIFAHSR